MRNDIPRQQEQAARVTLSVLDLARERKVPLWNAGTGFGCRAGNESQVGNSAELFQDANVSANGHRWIATFRGGKGRP
ncbi:hypothetical protein ABL845_36510 (plasmid) [Variovorax sp. NFACC29]